MSQLQGRLLWDAHQPSGCPVDALPEQLLPEPYELDEAQVRILGERSE